MDLLTLYLDRIRELRSTRIQTMCDGACKDFGMYQKSVGLIEGLNLAERELQELLKNQQESDDDDN